MPRGKKQTSVPEEQLGALSLSEPKPTGASSSSQVAAVAPPSEPAAPQSEDGAQAQLSKSQLKKLEKQAKYQEKLRAMALQGTGDATSPETSTPSDSKSGIVPSVAPTALPTETIVPSTAPTSLPQAPQPAFMPRGPAQQSYGPRTQPVVQTRQSAPVQPASPSPIQQARPTAPRQPAPVQSAPPVQPAACTRPTAPAVHPVKLQPQASSTPPRQAAPAATSGPSSVESFRAESSITTLQNFKIPLRSKGTAFSKVGRPITVETNYLAITLPQVKKLGEHYDVTIEPDKPKAMLFEIVQKYITTFFPQRFPAFDGVKNMYSYGPLLKKGEKSHSGMVKFENTKNKDYKVTIKLVSTIDFSSLMQYMKGGTSIQAPQEAMQCLDVVLRHSPQMRFTKVGRSFFTPPEEKYDLGGGMELWYGFFQSAVLGWKPFINVDVAHKGFPIEQNVIQYYESVCGKSIDHPMQRWNAETINKYIKGMKVRLTFDPSRTYRVNEMVTSARLAKFKGPNDRVMTVEQYFQDNKNIKLRYPNAPCLWVGSRDSKVYMPAELCMIVGNQVCNKRLSDVQVAAMIKKAATKPDIRKRKIQEKIRDIAYNRDPVVRDYGVSVADTFTNVPGRILDAPRLQYLDTTVDPRNGEWRSAKFSSPMELKEWVMVSLMGASRNVDLPTMAEMFMSVGRNLGMRIERPKQMTPEVRVDNLARVFQEAKSTGKQLVMVVVPGQGGEYAKVKQLAELQVGIMTQCLKQNTAARLNPPTASNLLLKMNAKLTGLNQVLEAKTVPACLKKPCMIVGADVTHPSPDQQTTPSFAAVAASFEKNCFKYNLTLSVQEPKKEMIQEFGDMMKEHLQFFQNKNKILPGSIYIFRDGVSEGQFSQVLDNELSAVYRSCEELKPGYKPKIMFLLVQKRHHTRFFPADNNKDRNGNVLAGTIVNTEITHPTELDFYLVSHAAIQGTARPTRYHCVYNDANMSDDDIEQLTYYLCHLYTRCTRSVSYPAPTYYAHLACTRAKVLLENKTFDIFSLQRKPERLRPLEAIVKEMPMFFV